MDPHLQPQRLRGWVALPPGASIVIYNRASRDVLYVPDVMARNVSFLCDKIQQVSTGVSNTNSEQVSTGVSPIIINISPSESLHTYAAIILYVCGYPAPITYRLLYTGYEAFKRLHYEELWHRLISVMYPSQDLISELAINLSQCNSDELKKIYYDSIAVQDGVAPWDSSTTS